MKNKRGYTIVELIIVIAVVGVLSFLAINKASYAFSDKVEAEEQLINQRIKLIELQASKYGEDHKDLFDESNTAYIRVIDLIDNNYMLTTADNYEEYKNHKIKLMLNGDKVESKLEK